MDGEKKMKITDFFVDNNGTNIHYIDSNINHNHELPFVIIPGLSESADDYLPLMKSLLPRRSIAITLRGRGKSDAPLTGYTLEEHISDIEVVTNHLNLKEFILIGYSRGVSYALGYAIAHSQLIKGIILGDYPAIHTELPPAWVDYFSSLPPWRGKPLSERMKPHALTGLQKDSKQIMFWDKLSLIECPVLIIRGGKKGSALSEEAAQQYLENFANATEVVFEESDHNIFEPNLQKVLITVKWFIESKKL